MWIQLTPRSQGFHLVTGELLRELPELRNFKVGMANIHHAYFRIAHDQRKRGSHGNLPHDASAFFEEGLKQSDKPVYGPVVKSLMHEYFSHWAVRH